MKKAIIALLLCASLLLAGCSLLTREYSTVTPHSASYYESGDSSVLRAENYQDLVNDILILVGQHAESGTISLYLEGDADVDGTISQACQEVQQDTPMGSYAVEYLSYTVSDQHTHSEISMILGYRRSVQQMEAMVHTTNLSALQSLLTAAVEEERPELVLQVSHFDDEPQAVFDLITEVQQSIEAEAAEAAEPWGVNLYPAEGSVGIVEIILKN